MGNGEKKSHTVDDVKKELLELFTIQENERRLTVLRVVELEKEPPPVHLWLCIFTRSTINLRTISFIVKKIPLECWAFYFSWILLA